MFCRDSTITTGQFSTSRQIRPLTPCLARPTTPMPYQASSAAFPKSRATGAAQADCHMTCRESAETAAGPGGGGGPQVTSRGADVPAAPRQRGRPPRTERLRHPRAGRPSPVPAGTFTWRQTETGRTLTRAVPPPLGHRPADAVQKTHGTDRLNGIWCQQPAADPQIRLGRQLTGNHGE